MLGAESSKPEVALTFDDPTTEGGVGLSWQQINERILTALDKGAIKSILFVCGKRVDNDSGSSLIAAWDKAGHGIGNHSYSHLYEEPRIVLFRYTYTHAGDATASRVERQNDFA